MKSVVSRIFALLVFCTTLNLLAQEVVYNRFNIHYYTRDTRGKQENFASSTGYVEPMNQAHGIIPFNSEIVIGKHKIGFTVTEKATGKLVFFELQAKFMGGQSVDDYIKEITSPAKVEYKDLSDVDQQGIKDGKVVVGMSKDGVKIAYGLPPKHMTPSLEGNAWKYWKDKFRSTLITFQDGKVSNIQ